MDSSLQPTTAATSDDGGENAMVALSEREKFLSTYVRDQPWSLPDSIIYYISKNPSNSKIYQKMIQTCKYFFIKNPLLVVSDLYVLNEKNQWNIFLNRKDADLNRVSSKIWITDRLRFDNDSPIPPNYFTTVLSKIYQSDVKVFTLHYQKIYISELELFASKCENIYLHEIIVFNEDDSVVGLEKIMQVLPKIEWFDFQFSNNLVGASANVMTSETVKKLIQISHFSNISYFYLTEIPEICDIDTFYDFIKINKKTKIYLEFVRQLSQEYRNRLQTIVNEIIATQNRDYRVPIIRFSGINLSSSKALFSLY